MFTVCSSSSSRRISDSRECESYSLKGRVAITGLSWYQFEVTDGKEFEGGRGCHG